PRRCPASRWRRPRRRRSYPTSKPRAASSPRGAKNSARTGRGVCRKGSGSTGPWPRRSRSGPRAPAAAGAHWSASHGPAPIPLRSGRGGCVRAPVRPGLRRSGEPACAASIALTRFADEVADERFVILRVDLAADHLGGGHDRQHGHFLADGAQRLLPLGRDLRLRSPEKLLRLPLRLLPAAAAVLLGVPFRLLDDLLGLGVRLLQLLLVLGQQPVGLFPRLGRVRELVLHVLLALLHD